ncbi:MAG: tripartite tricarboxylate transporter TctB family protein [Acidobacteria bacterium]|nr:tripartite tricarboxylate transporter TctB family protein [Acidobacteriota bacterium]
MECFGDAPARHRSGREFLITGHTTESASASDAVTQQPSPAAVQPLTRLNEDTIAGLAMLLVSAAGFILTFGFDEVPAILSQNVPPTFFPRVVLTTTALLSILLLIQGVRRKEPKKAPVPPIVFATAGVIAVAVLLLETLGVFTVIFLACVVLPLLWGERRIRDVLLFAALTPIAIYLLFVHFLQLRFPPGILDFIF